MILNSRNRNSRNRETKQERAPGAEPPKQIVTAVSTLLNMIYPAPGDNFRISATGLAAMALKSLWGASKCQ